MACGMYDIEYFRRKCLPSEGNFEGPQKVPEIECKKSYTALLEKITQKCVKNILSRHVCRQKKMFHDRKMNAVPNTVNQ